MSEVETAMLKARLNTATAKDLSLFTVILNWTGTSTSCGLQEFCNSVDTTADLGDWTDANKLRVATLKVVDTARACYDATPELHCMDIMWTDFKVFLRSVQGL
jgi:hypothetical protein